MPKISIQEMPADHKLTQQASQMAEIDIHDDNRVVFDKQKGVQREIVREYHITEIPFSIENANACLDFARHFPRGFATNAVDVARQARAADANLQQLAALELTVQVPDRQADNFLELLQQSGLLEDPRDLDQIRAAIG